MAFYDNNLISLSRWMGIIHTSDVRSRKVTCNDEFGVNSLGQSKQALFKHNSMQLTIPGNTSRPVSTYAL